MIKTIKLLKGSWFGRLLISVLCVTVLMLMMPAKAPATAVEYAVMLALIIVVCITAEVVNQPWHVAWGVVGNQMQTAAQDAAFANDAGDPKQELKRLGKVMGTAEAMMGMTSSCDNCGDLRDKLQQIIEIADLLKARALGVSGCHPDGIIQGNEQCDPLAVPTGCPDTITVGNITLEYSCNAQCQCESVPQIIP